MDVAITTRFFEKVCDVTGGDTTTAVHCLSDIARPLRLTDAQTWDAVDDLLSEGLLEPALVSGVQVERNGVSSTSAVASIDCPPPCLPHRVIAHYGMEIVPVHRSCGRLAGGCVGADDGAKGTRR